MTTKPERRFTRIPGYDHIRNPCQTPECGHGVHAEEWQYALIGDHTAITLLCFTDRYPPTVPAPTYEVSPIKPYDLNLHVDFPFEPLASSPDTRCDLLQGEVCTIYRTSALATDEFKMTPTPEQPPEFWRTLEDFWRKWSADAFRDRDEAATWLRCNCCDGLGRVRKSS